jgi:predicted NUDIX family NTP pyrophosphohydrolase
MKETSGTLLYRMSDKEGLEVLLVHPSGNYNRKSPWSIPKGLPDPGEELEAAARRETLEETGVTAEYLTYIGYADYTKSKKRIHCYAGPAPEKARPHCASWEVDKAEFVTLKKAMKWIHADQLVFLERLLNAFQKVKSSS